MSILRAIQTFLSGYPGMRPVRILTDGVAQDAESYAVAPSGNIRIQEDIVGNRTYENDYIFLARECTADEADRAGNYDFLEGLYNWLEEGVVPSNVMLMEIGDDGTGIYQVQIKLTFRKRRRM